MYTYQAEKALANAIDAHKKAEYAEALKWGQEADRLLDEAYECFEDDDSQVFNRMLRIEDEISHYIGVTR